MRFTGPILAGSAGLMFWLNAMAADPPPASSTAPQTVEANPQTPPSNITAPMADGPHTLGAGYPPLARRMGEQGIVTVRFMVTESGTVENPVAIRSSGFADLDDAALQTVREWRYKPATKDGKPIAVAIEANVKFQIDGEGSAPPPGQPYTVLDMAAADYPPDALAAKEEGQVSVMVAIAENGTAASAVLVRSCGCALLDQASMKLAVSRWHFSAATLDGKPVKSIVMLVLNWRLPSVH